MSAEFFAKAAEIIIDRTAIYGTADDNLARITSLWRAYLLARFEREIDLDPRDVAIMMVLLKITRCIQEPAFLDNWVDIAGYAACGAIVAKAK